MAVYVDPLMNYGWRLGLSCHMYADSLLELHEMAHRLGLKREWFQNHTRLPHYDLTAARRSKAVKLGAREVTLRHTAQAMQKYLAQKRRMKHDTGVPDHP